MEEHVLSDAVLEQAQRELLQGRNWIAYNGSAYFLDKENVQFFGKKWDAIEYAHENSADYNVYKVIYASSVEDLSRRLSHGDKLQEPEHHYASQKNLGMEQKNLEHLKDNLKYMGFGDKLNPELEKELAKGQPNFQLRLETEINEKAFAAVLNFRKSDRSDMYFFNSYHATLQRKDGDVVDQAFYLNKGKGVTAKEAFNLLDGRSVHKELTTKEGESYKAWLQLDFGSKDKNNNHKVKQFHEKYAFDLKAAVAKFAVAELQNPDKAKDLFKSLEKGNMQAVTIEKDGMTSKMFLEANPQFKYVTLYDAQLKRVPTESLGQFQSQSSPTKEMGQANTEGVKTSPAKEEKGKQQDNAKEKSVSEAQEQTKKGASMSVKELLPKKAKPPKQGVKQS